MGSEPIADDLRRFVLTSIPSVPHLEAILLLRGRPGHRWDCGEVSRRLYMTDRAASDVLRDLHDAALIAASPTPGCYTFEPTSPELKELIDRLAAAYSRDLIGITDLIHSKTGRKAQIFADAFKWRKKDD